MQYSTVYVYELHNIFIFPTLSFYNLFLSTSAALDSESEKTVVQALSNAMKKTKSLLMVTHRLGVVRSLRVNKVVVLDKGEIAEIGHPEELLKTGGIYAQLAREQGIVAMDNFDITHR